MRQVSILYGRVSNLNQRPDRQYSKVNYDLVLIDKCSGRIPFKDRPQGSKIMNLLRSNSIEVLTVHSIDRLGRNLLDVLYTIEEFNKKCVPLFIKDLGLSTVQGGRISPTAKLMISLLGSIYELERQNIRDRIKEGIEVSKIKGKQLGRKQGTIESVDQFLNKPKSRRILHLLKKDYTIREISSIVNCSPNTVVKVKRYIDEKNYSS